MTAREPVNPWKLSGYKPGQLVVCKVTNPEPGGYAVIVPKDNLPAFLTTAENHKLNEEILAEFVRIQDSRLLLCTRKRGPNHGSVQTDERPNPEKLSEYNSGQLVICKVIKSAPGGYAVIVSKDKCPGFISTRANFKDNEEILAEVLCVQENRLLLFAREDVSGRMQWNNESADKPQNPWGYMPGRKLVCKVISSNPGGYSVSILERNLTGFIRSRANLKVDEVIVAQFNCFDNGRILLSAEFFDTPPSEDGPDQLGAPVPKNPLPIIGADALSVPLPESEQNEKFEFE